MISPEILKRSATAGLLSVVTIGGAMMLLPDAGEPEAIRDLNSWADPVQVTYRSVDHPEHVIRRAPPPAVEQRDDGSREVSEAIHEASLEARNEAARRALDELQGAYDKHGPAPADCDGLGPDEKIAPKVDIEPGQPTPY
jgi:hypothetical protein